jgi:hypothetical protein
MALRAAEEAAERARTATAQALLRELLDRLTQVRTGKAPERTDWRSRCATLAQQPLPGETAAERPDWLVDARLVGVA